MDSEVALNALLYGLPSQSTIDYFRNQIDTLKGYANTAYGWCKEGIENLFNVSYGWDTINKARTVLQESTVMLRDDYLHQVTLDVYKPNLLTQSYIMEEPKIRSLYQRGVLSGFDGTYLDPEPNQDYHEFRQKYAEVVHGVVIEEDSGPGTIVRCYSHLEDEEPLVLSDKLLVLNNWKVALSFLNNDEDPTVVR